MKIPGRSGVDGRKLFNATDKNHWDTPKKIVDDVDG
jgi:hypothetical protein